MISHVVLVTGLLLMLIGLWGLLTHRNILRIIMKVIREKVEMAGKENVPGNFSIIHR